MIEKMVVTLPRALVLSVIFHFILYLGCISFELPLLAGAVTRHQALSGTLSVASVTSGLAEQFPATHVDRPKRPSPERLATKATALQSTFLPINSRLTAATDLPAGIPDNKPPEISRAAETPALSSIESREVLSVEGLGVYRLNLAREARRFKQYPAIAREQSWEGVVVLAIQAQTGSVVPAVLVEHGSGHDVLDVQALEMVLQAARQASIPESLRGKQFVINVPIHFRLAD